MIKSTENIKKEIALLTQKFNQVSDDLTRQINEDRNQINSSHEQLKNEISNFKEAINEYK